MRDDLDSLARSIVQLKNEFVKNRNRIGLLSEILPAGTSAFGIKSSQLEYLHGFARANPMYFKSYSSRISDVDCVVYEGDINSYWLGSKKHDTSYQPFYPTWILSAFALASVARSLGFEQVVDIGSGDGRIAYCASLLGMEAFGIEIDEDLVGVQNQISSQTGIEYDAIRADATRFDYRSLPLSRPLFFISGLPEMGEMMANSVISQVRSIENISNFAGFNLMGSHTMKPMSRDHTGAGWGGTIASFGLEVSYTVTLPTFWTSDHDLDTPYVYTRCR
jgi:SAM-dependent methyltransferase